ncbi:hypothetical protein [Clostridium aciditolerans]|uniref:Uncharacterized protein n=1 Tax=Clostridium aciditolerans TaxID=339861 RepID=A0A934M7D2_9CLOT|nr:hypothetical protein [Clostridium aciditolerans]MBI6873856.1 hypothetical protein [Clostridium aciditolerans]
MAIVYNHINFTHRKLIWFFVFDKLNMLRSIVCELDVKNTKETNFHYETPLHKFRGVSDSHKIKDFGYLLKNINLKEWV